MYEDEIANMNFGWIFRIDINKEGLDSRNAVLTSIGLTRGHAISVDKIDHKKHLQLTALEKITSIGTGPFHMTYIRFNNSINFTYNHT